MATANISLARLEEELNSKFTRHTERSIYNPLLVAKIYEVATEHALDTIVFAKEGIKQVLSKAVEEQICVVQRDPGKIMKWILDQIDAKLCSLTSHSLALGPYVRLYYSCATMTISEISEYLNLFLKSEKLNTLGCFKRRETDVHNQPKLGYETMWGLDKGGLGCFLSKSFLDRKDPADMYFFTNLELGCKPTNLRHMPEIDKRQVSPAKLKSTENAEDLALKTVVYLLETHGFSGEMIFPYSYTKLLWYMHGLENDLRRHGSGQDYILSQYYNTHRLKDMYIWCKSRAAP